MMLNNHFLSQAYYKICPIIIAIFAVLTTILKGLQPISALGITSYHIFAFVALTIYLIIIKSPSFILNKTLVTFLFVCFLSLLFSPPARYFHAWERLGFYVLTLGLCSPLINNNILNSIRPSLWLILLWCFRMIALGSFIKLCYFWMIVDSYDDLRLHNFSGITSMGMALAPICSIVAIDYLWRLCTCKNYTYKFWGYALLLISSLIVTTQAGSRIAVMGVIIASFILFFSLRKRIMHHMRKNISIISCILLLFITISPFISTSIFTKFRIAKTHNSITYSRDSKWSDRIYEFKSSPILGIGYSTQNTFSKDDKTIIMSSGNTEPGSLWLSLLSQTGIVGFMLIFFFNYQLYKRLLLVKKNIIGKINDRYLFISLLTFLNIHGIAEGWILYPGSCICYAYWLLAGVILGPKPKYFEFKGKYRLLLNN